MLPPPFRPLPPLVFVASGVPAAVGQQLEPLVRALAARLQVDCSTLPPLPLPAVFEGLQAPGAAGGPLAVLPVDPGLWMQGHGTWAEALGAWRQPVVAVVPAAAHQDGRTAGLVALLRQEGAPLVGVIQLGGDWQPEERRQDGLPWLGVWPLVGAEASGVGAGGDDPEGPMAATLLSLARALQGLAAAQ